MNPIQKVLLKWRDPVAYRHYKFSRGLEGIAAPELRPQPRNGVLHVKHSGNIGDIVYAIPCMLALAGDARIHLHLQVGQPAFYGKMHHPLGNVMLNEKVVKLLQPLLLQQDYIAGCDVWNGERMDADLDLVRRYPLLLDRGNIARWYFQVFAVNYDLNRAWLQVKPDASLRDTILVARSHRYHTPGIDYSFLNDYPKVGFVGLPDEYALMKKVLPRLAYLPSADFLDLAGKVAGCGLFIGNQSFPFALAEALKVRRLLEVYFRTPNVTVYGGEGYDFCFQPQFEQLVREGFKTL